MVPRVSVHHICNIVPLQLASIIVMIIMCIAAANGAAAQVAVVVNNNNNNNNNSSSSAASGETNSNSYVDDKEELDGGFSSLEGMLQWAIGHSDPAKLQETAEGVQHISTDELKKRQVETMEFMEKMKKPSDSQLMQIAINDVTNSSLPVEIRLRALEELLVLVEPIDNANDFQRVGGLAVVVEELTNSNHGIRTISAWILGKASQNNHNVQKQVLELGGLVKLMVMVKSSFVEEAVKALYAVSSLIRQNLDGQKLFLTESGDLILQEILINSSIDIRLRKKSVLLVADLAECQLETGEADLRIFNNRFLLKSVVDLIASTDLDLQEKALLAVKNLLQLRSVDGLMFKEFCGLDGILERSKQQLQQLIIQENQSEFVKDIENLLGEVEMIYLSKLDKVKCRRISDLYHDMMNLIYTN